MVGNIGHLLVTSHSSGLLGQQVVSYIYIYIYKVRCYAPFTCVFSHGNDALR